MTQSRNNRFDSRNNRFDYRIRIQVPTDSTDAVLFEYLREEQNRVYSHKEMVLSALRAYWLPIACEHYRQLRTDFTDRELKRLARNAIFHLRERADMLLHHFYPELLAGALNGLNSEAKLSDPNSTAYLTEDNLLYHADDIDLSQLDQLD